MGYFGSKDGAGVKERIIAAMPPHDTYIELFLGSGAVMRAKPPARLQIGVEANSKTIAAHSYPHGAQIIHGDALAYLGRFTGAGLGRVLIYADPPYVHATRGEKVTQYGKFEMSDEEHKYLCHRLGLIVLLGQADVMLSGYDNDIYKEHLDGYQQLDYQTMTRGGPRTESLWTSFTIGAASHWHTYAGQNKAERQQIQRKAARWAENYKSMTPGERLAIMAALVSIDSSQ